MNIFALNSKRAYHSPLCAGSSERNIALYGYLPRVRVRSRDFVHRIGFLSVTCLFTFVNLAYGVKPRAVLKYVVFGQSHLIICHCRKYILVEFCSVTLCGVSRES